MGPFRTSSERKRIPYHQDLYAQKKLFMQHGDMSGTWTAEQKDMILQMGMKPE
jgi:hypothetical protein